MINNCVQINLKCYFDKINTSEYEYFRFYISNAVSFLVIHKVIVCLTIDDILDLVKYMICIFYCLST